MLFHRKSSVNTSNENKDESVEIVVPSIFLLFQSAALWMQSFEDFNESTQNYHQSIRNNSEYENILVQALAILSAVDYTSSSEANEPSLLIPKIESFKIEFEMRALMIEKSTESLFTFISKWGDNLSSLEYLAGRLLLRSECPIQGSYNVHNL